MNSFDITTNPAKPTIIHDPQARLDYQWNLQDVLEEEDTIVAVTYEPFVGSANGPTAPGVNVEVGAIALDGKSAWAWVSITDIPTLLNKTVAITCHYTTLMGRIDDRTLYFKIKER